MHYSAGLIICRVIPVVQLRSFLNVWNSHSGAQMAQNMCWYPHLIESLEIKLQCGCIIQQRFITCRDLHALFHKKFTLPSQKGPEYQLATLFDLSVSEKELKRWMHNAAEQILYLLRFASPPFSAQVSVNIWNECSILPAEKCISHVRPGSREIHSICIPGQQNTHVHVNSWLKMTHKSKTNSFRCKKLNKIIINK